MHVCNWITDRRDETLRNFKDNLRSLKECPSSMRLSFLLLLVVACFSAQTCRQKLVSPIHDMTTSNFWQLLRKQMLPSQQRLPKLMSRMLSQPNRSRRLRAQAKSLSSRQKWTGILHPCPRISTLNTIFITNETNAFFLPKYLLLRLMDIIINSLCTYTIWRILKIVWQRFCWVIVLNFQSSRSLIR